MGPRDPGEGWESGGRVWRRLQCPRPLRMFIPGLRTAEGVWGCRDAARRPRGDWKGPENDLHLLLNCAFCLPPFPPSLKVLRSICYLRVHVGD